MFLARSGPMVTKNAFLSSFTVKGSSGITMPTFHKSFKRLRKFWNFPGSIWITGCKKVAKFVRYLLNSFRYDSSFVD